MRTLRSVLVLAAALAASGCYGYRGGWRSEAFVGTPPAAPARTAGPAHVLDAPLALPGVTIGVEIDNDLADSDRSVILQQVTNGIAVRMAALYLCAGGKPESVKSS